jgi:hypothetical protein
MQRRVPGVPVSDAEKARLHELGLVRRAEEPPPPATDKADRRGLLSRCLPTLLSLRAVVAALLVWNLALHYALKDAHAQLAAAPACNASNASAAYALLEEELLHDSEESLSRFIAGATREEEGLPVLKDIPVPGESAPPPPPPPAAAAAAPVEYPPGILRLPLGAPCEPAFKADATKSSCESFCVAKFFRAHCSRCKCRGCDFCPPPPTSANATASAPAAAAAANATTAVAPPAVADGANATDPAAAAAAAAAAAPAVVAAIANVTAPLTAAATAAAALAPPANATPAAEPPAAVAAAVNASGPVVPGGAMVPG